MGGVVVMTRGGRIGAVDAHGVPEDEWTADFLEQIHVRGDLKPGDQGYAEALLEALAGGSYLWAQPA